MQALIRILQESIAIISQNHASELQKFYANETLDDRIKTIIRKMENIKRGGEDKEDEDQIITQLRQFKDNLMINNTEVIEKIVKNKNSPEKFCNSLREIYQLFAENNKQLNLNLECFFFYKDMMQMIINDKPLTQDIINNQEGVVPEDKRNSIINLLRKVNLFKDEMKESRNKAEEMEALQKDNKVQLKEMEEELVKLLKEKEQLKETVNEKDNEIQKVKKAKEASQKQVKLKNEEIKTLNKYLQNQKKELETQKIEVAKQKKEIHVEKTEIMKQSEVKGKDSEGKIKQLQDKVKKLEKKLKDSQKKLQEKNDQMQKEIDHKQKQNEDLRKEIESFKTENAKMSQSSKINELDSDLMKKGQLLIETAEIFTSLFNKSSFGKNSSIMGSQIVKSYPSMNQTQAKAYFKDSYFMNDVACNAFLKELKHPTRTDVVYQYPQDKHIMFGDKIKGRRNLLLICRAETGSVIGGFTDIGFAKPKHKETSRCFIFASKGEHSVFLRAKKGKIGVTEDSDFLIFGCEQLSLQRNCSYATCYYLNYQSNNLQFQGNAQQRQKFKEIAGSLPPHHKIPLRNYEIMQLNFSK